MVVASATRCTASPYEAMRRLVPWLSRVCQASSNARATMSWSFAFTYFVDADALRARLSLG